MSFQDGDRIPVAREGELYSLKWHTFQSHLTSGLKQFLFDGEFLTDVTLVAEGKSIKSHRMLLSLCSPHFKQLFQGNSGPNTNTIVILNNVRYQDLQHVIQFIYNGEVKVSNNHELQGFLQTGELLQIEGLTKSGPKYETDGHEPPPPGQGQGGRLSPIAQSTPIPVPQMHRRSHNIPIPQVPLVKQGGSGHSSNVPTRSGSQQIPITSSTNSTMTSSTLGDSHSQQSNIHHVPPPMKRTRMMPSATVTSASYNASLGNDTSHSIPGDMNSSMLGTGGVPEIDPLAVNAALGVGEHDPLTLMDEVRASQHDQGGVPGIEEEEDEEQMITIDSIKSEAGVEGMGMYGDGSEEEEEGTFEMTEHGDVSGVGDMYGGAVGHDDSSGAGPSSAITGASGGAHVNVKPPGKRTKRGQIVGKISPSPIPITGGLICGRTRTISGIQGNCPGYLHQQLHKFRRKGVDYVQTRLALRCNKCWGWKSLAKYDQSSL